MSSHIANTHIVVFVKLHLQNIINRSPMNFQKRYYTISIGLSICVLLETLALTYMQQNGATFYYSSSILYFMAGLGICLIPLIPLHKESKSISANKYTNQVIPYLGVLFLLALIVFHVIRLKSLYSNIGIDKKWADMLPTIELACQRFLQGKNVYGSAPEIWDTAIIPYLPLMWVPFLPAIVFDFDLRWITLIVQLLGIALILKPILVRKKTVPFIPSIIAGLGLFLLLNFFLYKNTTYWSMTEEGIVAGFYLLLSYSLLRGNYWMIGLAITGCTLSRYSLLFWIPIYFAFIFFTKPRLDFGKLFLSYAVSMLLLFILPYFIKDPSYFINIPIGYSKLVPNFWVHSKIDEHLLYNVGLFKFFNVASLHLMPTLEVITSFLAPLLFSLIVWRLKNKYPLNERYISYISLKISLIFFFGFIQMPYMYIFVPVTLISYLLLFDYLAIQDTKD